MFTVNGGRSWSAINLPYETDPASLSCPSPRACIGVEQAIVPNGGPPAPTPLLAFRWSMESHSFNMTALPGSRESFGFPFVSCSSPDECVTILSMINSSDTAGEVLGFKTMNGGQSWIELKVPSYLTDVTDLACMPGTTSCVASGESNGVFGLFGFSLGRS